MDHRTLFFDVLAGKRPETIGFYPDITYWYVHHHTPPGTPHAYPPGGFIPDGAAIHQAPSTMPPPFSGMTLMDFYRRFDWGFHAHIYDWLVKSHADEVSVTRHVDGKVMTIRIDTPVGALTRQEHLATDGTWCVTRHFAQTLDDLDVLETMIRAERYAVNEQVIADTLAGVGTQGQADLVIGRSPFGKLVHEYAGFENVIYWLADQPERVRRFLDVQRERDLEVIHLAAGQPTRLVIISDHTDETLISPPVYARYCMPFYREACDVLHGAGKYVSTHLDGNIRGYLGLLGATGFDLLDGCTPAPMFNYEVEDLAAALPGHISAFCGVPATLFCQQRPDHEIVAYADRIVAALGGRVLLNVGDVLPPNGDIEQVIRLGRHVQQRKAANREACG